ncbi:MAG: SUMF1/EgtB/PvdO family nonheme iron enzyme, partial [Desulfococcaceae bacterium]
MNFAHLRRQIQEHPETVPLPLELLVADLRRQGFVVGVGHHIRLRRLLAHLAEAPGEPAPGRLKTLICPLFATDQRRQADFHRTWDRLFPAMAEAAGASEGGAPSSAEPVAEKTEETSQPAVPSRFKVILAGLLWVLLIGMVAFQFSPTPTPDQPETTTRSEPSGAPNPDPGDPPPIPREDDKIIEIPLSKGDPPTLGWYPRYFTALRWSAAFAPLLFGLLFLWWRDRRSKLALARSGDRPPYRWPLRVEPGRPAHLRSRPFYDAANRLRARVTGAAKALDIPGTLHASVQKAGFPDLRYRYRTRPPEYLILIERGEDGDHVAAAADTLSRALADEGIFVERFAFYDDPRICFRPEDGVRVRLSALRGRYPDHRLLVLGEGEGLLDSETGDLAGWVKELDAWPERAVLTPLPPREWSMREVLLARAFAVLPATPAGLSAAVDVFEEISAGSLRHWVRKDRTPRPPGKDEADLERLREYLGEAGFRWLRGCAVYPELNWGLTLQVGRILGGMTEEMLIRLIRLPWFRGGELPEPLRERLIEGLDAEDRRRIWESVCEVLERDPPRRDSAAWDLYRFSLAVQKGMVARDKRERLEHWKEAREAAGRAGEERILRSPVTVRLLREAARESAGAFRLPEALRGRLFRGGTPLLGVRNLVVGAAAVLAGVALFWSLPKPAMPVWEPGKVLELRFAHIPAEEFTMGSPEDEPGRYDDERQHLVRLTKDFWMQTTEVTQGQWEAVMGENPSNFQNCGAECPVERVSWNDAKEFIDRLNELDSKNRYRLPTEAEWEYSARAGTETALYNGPIEILGDRNAPALDPIAWYGGNSGVEYEGGWDSSGWPEKQYGHQRAGTHPVGLKEPNPWGLHDMIGNVWEWCSDWYGADYYAKSPVENP